MKTKHFIAFALALSVTFGMGYKALATGNSAQIETVICDNEDYRIVEKVIKRIIMREEFGSTILYCPINKLSFEIQWII